MWYFIIAHYWGKVKNRREAFNKVAKDEYFDPLLSNNWYYLSAERSIDPVVINN